MPAPKYTKKQWEAFSKDIGGESSFAKLREKLDAFEAGEFQFNQGFIKKYGKRGEFPKNDKMWEGRDAAMDANYKQHFTKAERKTIESEEFEESRPLPADKPKVKKLKGSTSTRPAEVEMQDNPKKKGTPKERFVQSRSKPRATAPAKPEDKRKAAKARMAAPKGLKATRHAMSRLAGPEAPRKRKPPAVRTSTVATGYEVEEVPLPEEAGTRTVPTSGEQGKNKERNAGKKRADFLRRAAAAKKLRKVR